MLAGDKPPSADLHVGQIPAPHLETCTRASPFSVSQMPLGSVVVCAEATWMNAIQHAIEKNNLAAIELSLQRMSRRSGIRFADKDMRQL